MTRNIILTFFCCCASALFAQTASLQQNAGPLHAPNVVTYEFLGDGLNASIQYERFFTTSISIRAGIGAFGFNKSQDPGFQWVPVLPVAVNYFIGEGNDKLELGVGAIIHLTNYNWETMFPALSNAPIKGTITIGYRFRPNHSAVNGGIGFTPVFDGKHIAPWLGFYMGYGF